MPILPYARLLRIPNVFTAFADIALGACAAIGIASPVIDATFLIRVVLLFIASGCLYCSGMVWNDFFDLEEDKRDRPFRPLPSGKITTRTAAILATILMLLGVAAAWASGWIAGESHRAGLIGLGLAVAVLAYDWFLKRTPLGPVAMGGCRFLNVLLGLTLADEAIANGTKLLLAATVGVYIVGVTWFARTEEKRSNPSTLRLAAGVLLLALGIALAVPTRVPAGSVFPFFPYLLLLFGFAVGSKVWPAITAPTPSNVQAAVKRCILGLVALDAVLATVFCGPWGLAILLLLPPGLILGKWVYST